MAFLEVNFFSDVLGMAMSMNVVLPQRTRGNIGVNPGEAGETFPTLWLLHGMSDDHTIWARRRSGRYGRSPASGSRLQSIASLSLPYLQCRQYKCFT